MTFAHPETSFPSRSVHLMGQGKKEEAEEVKKQVSSRCRPPGMSWRQKEKELEEEIIKDHDDDPEYHRSVRSDRKR